MSENRPDWQHDRTDAITVDLAAAPRVDIHWPDEATAALLRRLG